MWASRKPPLSWFKIKMNHSQTFWLIQNKHIHVTHTTHTHTPYFCCCDNYNALTQDVKNLSLERQITCNYTINVKAPSELCGQDVLRICLAPRLSKTSFQDVPRMSAAIQRFEFMNCCQKLGKCRSYEEYCSIAAAAALQQQHHCSSSIAAAATLQQQQHCSSSSTAAAAAASTLQQQQHCSNSTQHTSMHEANDVKKCEIRHCPLCITNECPWRSQWKQIHDVLDAWPVYLFCAKQFNWQWRKAKS